MTIQACYTFLNPTCPLLPLDACTDPISACAPQEPWQSYCVQPPCGQMNIINDNMYGVLENIFEEYNELFQPDMFHLGGDEVRLLTMP